MSGWAAGIPIVGDVLNYMGSMETNEANRDIAWATSTMNQTNAREQMEFQREMSNTAHQREVQDLKKAGLNPLLSLNAGASTPAGAAGAAQGATMENPFSQIATHAKEYSQLMLQIEKQKEEIKNIKANTAKTEVDAVVASKGIPEAEMKNDAYRTFIKPTWQKLKGLFQTGPIRDMRSTPQQEKAFQQFDQKVRMKGKK